MGVNQSKGLSTKDPNRHSKSSLIQSLDNHNASFSQRACDFSTEKELAAFNSLSINQHVPILMIVLYDFTEVMENQISIKSGQLVRRLTTNPVGDWSEVEYPILPSNHLDRMNLYRRGWVPTSYLAPADPAFIQQSIGFINPNTPAIKLPPHKKSSCSALDTMLPALPTAQISPISVSHQSQSSPGNFSTNNYNFPPHSTLSKYPWFHGPISREAAEQLLKSGITGSFLVRCSESKPGELSVTVRNSGRVYHYRITQDSMGKYYITDARRFQTIGQLIEHHSNYADGLVCPLQFPAPKKTLSDYPSSGGGFSTSRSAQSSNSNNSGGLECWEIDRTEIVMRHKLGSGQYGDVYEAWWNKYFMTVAVKTVKQNDPNVNTNDFLKEAAIMRNLRHKNLVQLLGVCTREPPFYLVTEYMPFGNLLLYLRNSSSNNLTPPVLLHMAVQIALGMAYLETHNYIHRDLAARNCLVGENNLIKVADFGLARFIRQDIYTARNGAKFPIKWTAPEGLSNYTFSSKSDVWAFGVVLWELATYGRSPYPGVELHNVYHLLEKGLRMERPVGCPEAIYNIMLQCWSWNSFDRPSFTEIVSQLEHMNSHMNIEAEVARELDQNSTEPIGMKQISSVPLQKQFANFQPNPHQQIQSSNLQSQPSLHGRQVSAVSNTSAGLPPSIAPGKSQTLLVTQTNQAIPLKEFSRNRHRRNSKYSADVSTSGEDDDDDEYYEESSDLDQEGGCIQQSHHQSRRLPPSKDFVNSTSLNDSISTTSTEDESLSNNQPYKSNDQIEKLRASSLNTTSSHRNINLISAPCSSSHSLSSGGGNIVQKNSRTEKPLVYRTKNTPTKPHENNFKPYTPPGSGASRNLNPPVESFQRQSPTISSLQQARNIAAGRSAPPVTSNVRQRSPPTTFAVVSNVTNTINSSNMVRKHSSASTNYVRPHASSPQLPPRLNSVKAQSQALSVTPEPPPRSQRKSSNRHTSSSPIEDSHSLGNGLTILNTSSCSSPNSPHNENQTCSSTEQQLTSLKPKNPPLDHYPRIAAPLPPAEQSTDVEHVSDPLLGASFAARQFAFLQQQAAEFQAREIANSKRKTSNASSNHFIPVDEGEVYQAPVSNPHDPSFLLTRDVDELLDLVICVQTTEDPQIIQRFIDNGKHFKPDDFFPLDKTDRFHQLVQKIEEASNNGLCLTELLNELIEILEALKDQLQRTG